MHKFVLLIALLSTAYSKNIHGFLRMPAPPRLRKTVKLGLFSAKDATASVMPLLSWWTQQLYDIKPAANDSYDVAVNIVVKQHVYVQMIMLDASGAHHPVNMSAADMMFYEKGYLLSTTNKDAMESMYFSLSHREL